MSSSGDETAGRVAISDDRLVKAQQVADQQRDLEVYAVRQALIQAALREALKPRTFIVIPN